MALGGFWQLCWGLGPGPGFNWTSRQNYQRKTKAGPAQCPLQEAFRFSSAPHLSCFTTFPSSSDLGGQACFLPTPGVAFSSAR